MTLPIHRLVRNEKAVLQFISPLINDAREAANAMRREVGRGINPALIPGKAHLQLISGSSSVERTLTSMAYSLSDLLAYPHPDENFSKNIIAEKVGYFITRHDVLKHGLPESDLRPLKAVRAAGFQACTTLDRYLGPQQGTEDLVEALFALYALDNIGQNKMPNLSFEIKPLPAWQHVENYRAHLRSWYEQCRYRPSSTPSPAKWLFAQ